MIIFIEPENADNLKKLVKRDNIEYPTMKNAVNKILREYFNKEE